MNRYFTADTHIGHTNKDNSRSIITFGRSQFATVPEHDEYIAERINSRVERQDELYILGDVAWNADAANKFRARVNCKHIHVLLGNHDSKGLLTRVFGTCPDVITLKGFGKNNEIAFMSHYPHAFWPSSHYGAYHLYGHMHTQRERWLDEHLGQGRRSIDVGADNAKLLLGDYVPFSQDELLQILGERAGHDDLQFYRDLDKERTS